MRARDLHAAAAAAERRLDGHGNAVFLGEGHDLVGILHRVRGTGHQGCFGPRGDVAGGDLVAEVADGLRARPDPDQPGVDDRLREIRVLRKESVSGVDRVRARLRGRVQDLLEDEIGLGGRLAAEREGLVGEPYMRRVGVGLGVHSHAR